MANKTRAVLIIFGITSSLVFSCNCRHDAGIKEEIKTDTVNHTALYLDSTKIDSFIAKYPFAKSERSNLIKSYAERKNQYLWLNKNGLIQQGELFVNQVNAVQSGLLDTLPGIPQMNALYRQYLADTSRHKKWTSLELALTTIFYKYGRMAWGGMGENASQNLNSFLKKKRMRYDEMIDSIQNNLKFYTSRKASYRQYALLEKYLRKYIEIDKHHLWKPLAAGNRVFCSGDSAAEIKNIRVKLFLLGDLVTPDTNSAIFDKALAGAVKKFQRRYGMKEDGDIEVAEFNMLNKPMRSYIEPLLVNMERTRWVYLDVKGDHLMVNIPEFKLYAYEDDKKVWSCSIVAGADQTKTVMFNGSLRYIVFAPYWNIPTSVVKNNILPLWQTYPDTIKKNTELEVIDADGKVVDATKVKWKKYNAYSVPYLIRQKPGGENPLGKVKFLFPNNFSIYLHDTPWKNFFSEKKRTFSHGCIRLSDAEGLARWLLRDDKYWTEKKFEEAFKLTKEQYFTLKKGVPVFICYFTTWVDENGELNYRDDLYGHDGRLLKTLLKD